MIQLFSEAKILEALDHPNIIRFREFYKTQSDKLVMILEFCPNGDLNDFIENQEEYLPEEVVTSKLIRMDCSIVFGFKVLS